MPEPKLPPSLKSVDGIDLIMTPATAALEKMTRLPKRERKRAKLQNRPAKQVTASVNGSPNDITNLLKASKPVEEGLSFPLIEWSFDDNFSSDNEQIDPITTRRPQLISSESEGDETTTTNTSCSPLGKRIGSLISTNQRLVRSIALDAHLSLLETSILPIEMSRSSCSISRRSSSSSFSKKFNVDEWLDCADLTRSGPSSLSKQNLLSIHREESRHSLICGLPLTTT
jgi:hypothetical protein